MTCADGDLINKKAENTTNMRSPLAVASLLLSSELLFPPETAAFAPNYPPLRIERIGEKSTRKNASNSPYPRLQTEARRNDALECNERSGRDTSHEEGRDRRRRREVEFLSPLLHDGYPPSVEEDNRMTLQTKPVLLYLPGFDGTVLAPFMQFPSLGEEFDVRAMRVSMDDRSTFDELKAEVVGYVERECAATGGDGSDGGRGVYLMGESFGGILATQVSAALYERESVDLRGLVLVNPATCYKRSGLYELGPPVANNPISTPVLSDLVYIYQLTTDLVPLFLDRGVALNQLIAILSSRGLPAVLNSARREAYMGRVAFDLANRLKFMPKTTLKWRLEEWLEYGCDVFEDQLSPSKEDGDDAEALWSMARGLRTLIVAGEHDLTLPSIDEAERLSSEVFRDVSVHVVPDAGHASTCGGSLNLIRLIRETFYEDFGHNDESNDRTSTELFGLEPRYDGASIGLSPLKYWSNEYYSRSSQ